LHRDAKTAYDWLAAKIGADNIIIQGSSLGSGVAAKLASENPAKMLVLESPYTAAVDVAARRFWFLPVQYMMHDTFLTRDWIGKVKMPVLVAHGLIDQVIPVDQGKAVFELAPQPKKLVLVEKASHNNLVELGLYDEIVAFAAAK
jgi:uncharacterized protein